MAVLPDRAGMRNSKSLPLFEWAEKNQASVFNPLLITQKLARHLRIPASTLNAMAEANGYNGRETDQ
ncbi:MAG: hypothetical protein GY751_09320 [Bacteroidetes bacterium]|nr:hypothetical protein [Bacteroidota bacterium]